ncbi:PREDICTED: mammalian ependymin-related protein 1 isoform X2 [Chinchilla lanigera]|uniref:mammalian ependymin-related protein 1 isoform X2 n=1 Tax=Chinchilla lanigera TaxID=34839 RepID=UPI0006968223|nr:PREDICTED: mammalian ependymin-related protein 1 isoform X2 [Chinchilla lanigera]
MPGRAPPREAPGTPGAWLWVCVLGGLCALGTAGFPGTPRPCQAPQQWEGRQVLYQQSSGRNSRALLSYDGPNRRVRVLDEKKALIPCKRYQQSGQGNRCYLRENMDCLNIFCSIRME